MTKPKFTLPFSIKTLNTTLSGQCIMFGVGSESSSLFILIWQKGKNVLTAYIGYAVYFHTFSKLSTYHCSY